MSRDTTSDNLASATETLFSVRLSNKNKADEQAPAVSSSRTPRLISSRSRASIGKNNLGQFPYCSSNSKAVNLLESSRSSLLINGKTSFQQRKSTVALVATRPGGGKGPTAVSKSPMKNLHTIAVDVSESRSGLPMTDVA